MTNLLKKHIKKFSTIVFILFLTSANANTLQNKIVETTGNGITEKDAIKDAIISAIAQVKGFSLDSEEIETTRNLILNNQEKNSSDFQSKVKILTKGIVSSYKVLSTQRTQSGGYSVRVSSVIPHMQASVQSSRLRLTLMPLRIANDLYSKESEAFAKSWMQELENSLVQTRRFAILDRQFESEISNELESYKSNDFKIEELARLGQKLGTDYIVVGTLMNFAKTDKFDSNNLALRRNFISIRIIDISTGQVKFAKRVSSAQLTSNQIIEAIYPLAVISLNADKVTIGSGGDNMSVGQQFDLIQLGKQLIDPYTKEELGNDERVVGRVEIIKVSPKTSVGQITQKNSDFNGSGKPKFILRASSDVASETPKNLESENW